MSKFMLVALFSFVLAPAVAAQSLRTSPFEMVRFNGESPEVRVGGEWYAPLRIGDVAVEEVLRFLKNAHGSAWDKRFCEDLPENLAAMGHAPGGTVDLVLRSLESQKTVTKKAVALTAENRARILRARPRVGGARPSEPRSSSPRRVDRKHGRGDRRFDNLTLRVHDETFLGPHISALEAAEDLDELEWHLENEFSYLTRTKVPYRKALDTVRAKLGDRIAVTDFHIQLRKLVALFGDGHSRVAGLMRALPGEKLPCRLADVGGRWTVLDAEGRGLVADGFPFLEAIDGVPMERWIEAATPLAPRGAPQLIRSDVTRWLSWVGYLRGQLGVAVSDNVTLTLESPGGKSKNVELELSSRPAFFSMRLDPKPRVLDGNFGYLRIADMGTTPDDLRRMHDAMATFRNTAGLVIDVRGNTGGRRDALVQLFPYFLAEDDPPYIANVAAYRLPPDTRADPEGYLGNRSLFPATSTRWTESERKAIGTFAKRFSPKWKLPKGKFSDWHYMILRREGAQLYHYDRPVVVLLDEECFSATDIFLGAFSGRRNVTLMGVASGGGSGRSRTTRLSHSDLIVRLSSMASYRPNGRLYEGRGVEPDVVARRTLSDALGKSDSVLEKAIKLLRKK